MCVWGGGGEGVGWGYHLLPSNRRMFMFRSFFNLGDHWCYDLLEVWRFAYYNFTDICMPDYCNIVINNRPSHFLALFSQVIREEGESQEEPPHHYASDCQPLRPLGSGVQRQCILLFHRPQSAGGLGLRNHHPLASSPPDKNIFTSATCFMVDTEAGVTMERDKNGIILCCLCLITNRLELCFGEYGQLTWGSVVCGTLLCKLGWLETGKLNLELWYKFLRSFLNSQMLCICASKHWPIRDTATNSFMGLSTRFNHHGIRKDPR